MNKILVICGPTATGKTALAINIAKKLNGEIISADSRQVYKGMDIGTGKDIPKGARFKKSFFSKYGYYEIDAVPAGRQGVKIWGYDLADPKRDFSVAQYLKIAHKIIDDVAKRGRLPILVGGSGLYIKGVIDGIPTAEVPKNEGLRKNLEERGVEELYEKLSQIDSFKAGSLNSSDRKNPRRLMRAIEVAQYQLTKKNIPVHHAIGKNYETLFLGLIVPGSVIAEKIKNRVFERVKNGVKDEVRRLLRSGVRWEDQSMMSLGYGVWRDNFEGGIDEDIVISEWTRQEIKYGKRQMTWFKKDNRIRWFDITKKEYPDNVENLVKKWYKTK